MTDIAEILDRIQKDTETIKQEQHVIKKDIKTSQKQTQQAIKTSEREVKKAVETSQQENNKQFDALNATIGSQHAKTRKEIEEFDTWLAENQQKQNTTMQRKNQ